MTANARLARWSALATLATLAGCSSQTQSSASPDVFTAALGKLRITVREAAELKSATETRVQSEVEGQATVIFLIPEGTVVKKGDRLVELDASALIDRQANQRITVERSLAALVGARQDMEILEKEIKADLAEAQSKLHIAQIDLERFLGRPAESSPGGAPTALESEPSVDPEQNGHGTQDSPQRAAQGPRGKNREMLARLTEQIAETRFDRLGQKALELLGPDGAERDMGEAAQEILRKIDDIVLATARMKLSEDTLSHSKRLAAKNYVTRNELDRDQLDFDSQKSQVTRAWNDLDLLVNYTLLKEKIDLELKVDNAELGLDRVKASAAARRAREEAELSSKQSEYDLAKERLDNLDKQIQNAVIRAPNNGLVVYASLGDGRRGREVVEEGTSVRERQTLIILPDLSRMVASLKVQEADIDKVARGQRATIRIDASHTTYAGQVSRVSPLPDSGSRWTNTDLKVYKTEVEIRSTNDDGVLRPGMSAEVEVLIDELDDVLTVPLQAVRRQGAVHYLWFETKTGPLARAVEIGRNNLTHVQIVEGLAAGERVFLAPPTGIKAPDFPQPPRPESPSPVPDDSAPPPKPEEPPAREAGPRPGGAVSSPALDELREILFQRRPDFAERAAENPRGFMRDEEVRAFIDADPELKAKYDAIMQDMRARFGGGRRGEGNGESGGRRGGDRGSNTVGENDGRNG